jgi:hypothetical protein
MSLANYLSGSGRLPFVQNEYRVRDLKVTQMEAQLIGAPIQLRGVGLGGDGTQQILGIDRIDCNSLRAGLILDGSGNDIISMSDNEVDISGSLVVGSSAARVDKFSADDNLLQAYASYDGNDTRRAARLDLSVSGGDGSASHQAVRGNLTLAAASHSEEGYGAFNLAQQNDGSQVDSNLIGQVGFARVLEEDAADQPQQWIAGTQSIIGSNDTADVPTASIVTASLAQVTYDAALNGVAHGYVASRNGAGTGVTAGSAYKVLIGGAIDDWEYGVDLDTGSGTNNYSVADMRLSQSNRIHTGAGAPAFATTAGSMYLRIDGANAGEVLYVNHDGLSGSWAALS